MVHGKTIIDEKSRNTSFQTRKTCLMKKASELSTLSDTDVCLIIYGPSTGDRPETFPQNRDEVKRIITRFRAPEHPKTNMDVKRKLVFEEEATGRVLKKSRRSSEWEGRVNDLSVDQAAALLDKLRSRIEDVKSMIVSKEKEAEKGSCDVELEFSPAVSSQEIDVNYNAKPIAFWIPGCPAPAEIPHVLGAMNPVMMIDAMGCIQPGGPLSNDMDQYVPVLCYVPLSSQQAAYQLGK